MFDIDRLIKNKENGLHHTSDEIKKIVKASHQNNYLDKKITLWLKSVFKNGMNRIETVHYTNEIIKSGEQLDFKFLDGVVIDKHSTGGVGDKVSLILGPILAACGCYVPMIVGRALGHTGGTLDKLESIKDYNGLIGLDRFKKNVTEVGISIIGQTDEICPADKKIYRLRDLSNTIKSFPLICGSIMGKKIAEGIQALVLDIKTGNGAFMETISEANNLGEHLKSIGSEFGVSVDYSVTNMNQPLGKYSGLLCEVFESVEFLKGSKSDDLTTVIYHLGDLALKLSGINNSKNAIDKVLNDGSAYEIFCKMIYAHGGDLESIFLKPKETKDVIASDSGYINFNNTVGLGNSINALSPDNIVNGYKKFDPQSGFKLFKKNGNHVDKGDRIAKIFCTNKINLDNGFNIFNHSFNIQKEKPKDQKMIF